MNDVAAAIAAEAEFAVRVRSLQPHPLAEMFPLIEGDDFATLVEDIRANGIRFPIMLYQGRILDGRNRYRAAVEAGHCFTERDFANLVAGIDAEAWVISANLQRRNLDNRGKRAVIAKLIEAKPGQSDRAIARLAGVDHKTVASVRTELAQRAQAAIAMLDSLSPAQLATVIAERGDKLRAALGL
jgi:hypothetical protein